MKVLYISYDGMTDPLGQSQVIPYLIGLARAGHAIVLMSCEKPDRFKKNETQIRNLLEDGNIEWVPLPYTSKPPVISTIMDIRSLRKKAFELIHERGIEVVHCRSYISALVGLAAKKKFGCRFIFDMRGFWADERVDGGLWTRSNPLYEFIYRFFKRKEKEFLLEADQVISLTNLAAKEIHSWSGFQHVPIVVIPCCADLQLFSQTSVSERKRMEFRASLALKPTDFVLSYLGSLGTWYMLDEMLRFFKLLSDRKPQAVFLFITADSPEHVFQAAERLGVERKHLRIQAASRAEVPVLASLSDVSVFFIRQAYSKKASSPTKMGELMGLGIPLISNDGVGDVAEIVKDGGNGLMISAFTDEEYTKVLDQLDALLALDPASTIACAERYYSLDAGIELYKKVYTSLNHS